MDCYEGKVTESLEVMSRDASMKIQANENKDYDKTKKGGEVIEKARDILLLPSVHRMR